MNGQLNRTFFQDMLGSFHDVDCVQEPLPVGDMTWVARRKRGVAEQLGRPRDEYILLDTIVERKTAADLVSR